LIALIEINVGKDLQYIRFNGSLIGGLAVRTWCDPLGSRRGARIGISRLRMGRTSAVISCLLSKRGKPTLESFY